MTFIDLPITGDKNPTHTPSEQRPRSELEHALRDVLDLPMISAVRWRQYTPYFNDGDACVFGVGEVTFALAGHRYDGDGDGYFDGDTVTDYGDGFYSSYDDDYQAVLGSTAYDLETRTYRVAHSPNPEASEAVLHLTDVIYSGAHNASLGELFGDHAVVTASKTGFVIDGYDHD